MNKNKRNKICLLCQVSFIGYPTSKYCSPECRYIYLKWIDYQSRSIFKGREFALTPNDFLKYSNVDCYYCGQKINGVGFDRVDSRKGYVLSNVVPCCQKCNMAKYNMEESVFWGHIKKIYENGVKNNKFDGMDVILPY